jgi:hypothetical protein
MRALALFTLLLVIGCRTQEHPKIGMGDVHVPSEFHPTLNWLDKPKSHYERYLEMFREGYWNCITKYHENINYMLKKPDTYANGWLSEVAGYADGYMAAERDMQRNIRLFGKERTAKYLRDVWDGGG